MAKDLSINEAVEEIYQSILATPKKQRRLKSSTFWSKFGVERRNPDRVEQVRIALEKHSIVFNLENSEFGIESKGDWIILSYLEAELPQLPNRKLASEEAFSPSADWFKLVQNRSLKSEREVEHFFVIPLLEKLGYVEEDFAIGFRVEMYEGVKKVSKEADIVAFDGRNHSKENALLVVEAKSGEKRINEDNVGQARSYSLNLFTPYYVVTNGDELRLYAFRSSIQPDVQIMNFTRNELCEKWSALYGYLNKFAVLHYKEKLKRILLENEI